MREFLGADNGEVGIRFAGRKKQMSRLGSTQVNGRKWIVQPSLRQAKIRLGLSEVSTDSIQEILKFSFRFKVRNHHL